MEITGVPKSFWHASSFCIVALTISFIVFSFKSGELNIKFNQLEIKATQTLALQQTIERQKQNLDSQRKLIEERSKILSDVEGQISTKISELKKLEEELTSVKDDIDAGRLKDFYDNVLGGSITSDALVDKKQELKAIQRQESLYLDLYNRDNELYERQKTLRGNETVKDLLDNPEIDGQ
ncbi:MULTISPECIES: hypothetical protein [Vibrio]|uniref:hypothetical protein n=1 Tax=Vibrio TaxID=662 RepID=UPI000804369D|nr:hypothetical protein [Vibrio natriegens]ANQ16850.1 hypothetical protein BA891_06290 [Vibrio natriegens]MEE3878117.1 hypothetical protein [Vibrio sp. YYF0003]